jgi:hypothetical protein
MNEDSILLLEDMDAGRWQVVQQVATELNLDYYPKSSQFRDALLSVDEWLHFLTERRPFVCIDLRIGKDGGSSHLTNQEDIDAIVQQIQANPAIQALDCQAYFDRIQQHQFEWVHKIATLTLGISIKLGLRCVLVTGGTDTKVDEYLNIEPVPRLMPFTPESLRQAILTKPGTGYTLDDLWRDTREFNVHDDLDRQETFKSLRQLLGLNPKSKTWISHLNDNQVNESLKTLCGQTATTQEGDKPLSLLGAFHLLMGAIALKTEKPADTIPIDITIEPDNGYFRQKIMPYQSMELARVTVRLLYKLFGQIVLYDEGHEQAGRIMIQSIHLHPGGLDITLDLHARRSNWKTGKSLSLADSINYAARNYLDSPILEKITVGEVARLTTDFNQAANIKDSGGFAEGLIFPQGSGIEIHSLKDKTLLRLKPCPTS